MSCKKCKNPCTPCEQEEKCLGCEHYHSTECITLEEPFGTQPTGTNLTTTLAYIWTLLDGGNDGEDGVGVQGATVNGSGELVITLTDGTIINAGNVKGADGADGIDGTNGTNGTNGTDGADGEGANFYFGTSYETCAKEGLCF